MKKFVLPLHDSKSNDNCETRRYMGPIRGTLGRDIMKKNNNSIPTVFYSEEELRDPVCCLCGEKGPEQEYRGLGVCRRCIEHIRSND